MSYPQRAPLRGVPGPNVLGAAVGFLVLIIGVFVTPLLFFTGVAILVFFVFREIIQSRSPVSRARTDVPALMEQIRGINEAVFGQAPGVVRENMERAMMTNIDKLEEIALGLEQEANVQIAGFRDPRAERKEQAAIKLGLLVKDLLEAHAKFTELTGRMLPSRVLKRDG